MKNGLPPKQLKYEDENMIRVEYDANSQGG